VGFVVDKVALGQVFSEYLGFPCQFSFHQLLHIHHHYLSSGASSRPISGWHTKWDSVSPHPKKRKEKETKRMYSLTFATKYRGPKYFLHSQSFIFGEGFNQ
jgi:hypothetical protein